MKPVTNLLTVTHTRNEARRKLVKSRDETCHKLRSITILNHRCLWTVTNLQWNLLQNRDETCYRLVNCYKLVIKLVTNLLRVTKLSMKIVTNFLFSVKGGSQARPFPSVQSVEMVVNIACFLCGFRMMRLGTSHLMHTTVTKKRSTLCSVLRVSFPFYQIDGWSTCGKPGVLRPVDHFTNNQQRFMVSWPRPWTVPKTDSVLPLSEDFVHTWRTVKTVHRF